MGMQGITRANFGQHFMPVAWKYVDLAYGDAASQYDGIFRMENTVKPVEYSLHTSGFGMAKMYDEMETMPLDSLSELGTSRVVMEKTGLGFALSWETIEDEQAPGVNNILSRSSTGVGKGMMAAGNQRAFLLFNEATSASRVYQDGKSLAANDHPMTNGQTIDNLTTDELAETSVKDALIAIANLKDDRGLPADIKADMLVTTKENMFRAREIFESALSTIVVEGSSSGVTNTNNKNVIQGTIGGGVKTVDYLTNSKAWFIKTNAANGFVKYIRKAKQNRDWKVDSNEYHVYASSQRDAFFCDDPARAVYFANPA